MGEEWSEGETKEKVRIRCKGTKEESHVLGGELSLRGGTMEDV